jgi:hypothetical protein
MDNPELAQLSIYYALHPAGPVAPLSFPPSRTRHDTTIYILGYVTVPYVAGGTD